MKKPAYRFIDKLIGRITTSGQSDNDTFLYYGHLVELRSGTEDFVSVTIYKGDDRYKGEMADFDFDYWTYELHFIYSECEVLTKRIVRAFKSYYAPHRISVSYDWNECEDEENTDAYDKSEDTSI